MNAGRNTATHTPLPPTTTEDELGEESADSETRFVEYVLAYGIPLADFEDTA